MEIEPPSGKGNFTSGSLVAGFYLIRRICVKWESLSQDMGLSPVVTMGFNTKSWSSTAEERPGLKRLLECLSQSFKMQR
jgi:hypothetical protein